MVTLQPSSSIGVIAVCVFVCLGNLVTLIAICRYRVLQTKWNLLVAHLAIVDFITGLTTWPTLRYLAVDGGSRLSCLVGHAIVSGLKFASLLFLFDICIVMYTRVVYPLHSQYLVSQKRLNVMSALTWLISTAIGCLCLIWQQDGSSPIVEQCFMTLIPFAYWLSCMHGPYMIISMVILIMYVRIVKIARDHLRQANSQAQNNNASSSGSVRLSRLASSSGFSRKPTLISMTSLTSYRGRDSGLGLPSLDQLALNRRQKNSYSHSITVSSSISRSSNTENDNGSDPPDMLSPDQESEILYPSDTATPDKRVTNSKNTAAKQERTFLKWRRRFRSDLPVSTRYYRNVVQMTLTMMFAFLAFVICWLPLEIAIYFAYCGIIKNVSESLFVEIGLAMSLTNSGVNVFIYSWRYKAFRKAILNLLTCGRSRIR